MTHDFIISDITKYLLIKIGVVILALLLWFVVTAVPVI